MHRLAIAQAWEWGDSGCVPLVQQRHQRREMGTHTQHHSECSSFVHQGAPTCRCELAKGGTLVSTTQHDMNGGAQESVLGLRALAHSLATLPGVSSPDRVVKSMQVMAVDAVKRVT